MKIGRRFLCAVMACVFVFMAGCGYPRAGTPKVDNLAGTRVDRITYLYFISCTDWDNSFVMDESSLGEKWKSGLRSPEHKELISAVKALPDAASTDGELAYIIRIKFFEDGEEKILEKSGYDAFPDNWGTIIELLNKTANGYTKAGGSTTISKVDADFVREHGWYLDESVLPKGLTLEDVVRDMPLTYFTMYDPENGYGMDLQRAINDYVFNYLDLEPNRVYELKTDPPKSTTAELIEFAASHLDKVYDVSTGKSVMGEFNGVTYEIVKYDEFQLWYDQYDRFAQDRYKRNLWGGSDGMRYNVEEYGPDNGTMMIFSLCRYLDVDSSGKFIILPETGLYKDIVKVVK